MSNYNELEEYSDDDNQFIDFDELQNELETKLEEQLIGLDELNEDFKNIGNPDVLGETIGSVIWEQFILQVGVIAGEDFIKENRNLKLDLRNSAHIQTTENFEKGKIAKHNSEIDYEERYTQYQNNFRKDDNGNIHTHYNRMGKEEKTVDSGARKNFDKGRPTGSILNNTDMDHVVSAGEIIRDAQANAHLTVEEQVTFANGTHNLNEMDASQNRSKSDLGMTDWLDNPNKNGQKPNEIFEISDKLDKDYREKDKIARKEYEKQKLQGEERSKLTGKKSQKAEAFRIGGKALQAVLMT
ncbi:cation diffusion facilitator family transporter, partial [Myroides sp. LoEW2-1]|nr:cation diffusion facilitator family transporter [Myroides sp. LoEW2-1]